MDFKLCPLSVGGVDLQVANGDLVMDPGFITAILASLWTDRRANDDDGLAVDEDPRGYCFDREGDRWGSRLWLLDRAKRTQESLGEAEDFSREGLEWMRTAGAITGVKPKASYNASGHLVISLPIERDLRPRWDDVWKGTDQEIAASADGQSLRVLIE